LKKQRLHEETEQSFENRALCVKRQREEKKKDKFGLVEREMSKEEVEGRKREARLVNAEEIFLERLSRYT